MWQAKKRISVSGRSTIYQILLDGIPLNFEEVFQAWKTAPDFVQFYSDLLAKSGYEAFFWEHPPLSLKDLHQPYQFILIDAPRLALVQADVQSFAEHFQTDKSIVSFPNLGKNALLVVPKPVPARGDYPSLAAFIRRADSPQLFRFWQVVSHALGERLDTKPCWLNTAGMGVHWLHLRLDDRPKYYRYKVYKDPDYWTNRSA